METIKWHPKFDVETGNAQIDSEHEQLLCLLDACLESSRNGATKGELIVRLNEIREHVANHFKNEEFITASAGMPHPDSHKMQHKHFLDLINTRISELSDSINRRITVQEVLIDLYDWYELHLENADKKLVFQK